MTTDIDKVRDIIFCAVEDNLYRIEALFDAKDQRIAELETELRITQAALARATKSDVTV